jgi:hypothetical protein
MQNITFQFKSVWESIYFLERVVYSTRTNNTLRKRTFWDNYASCLYVAQFTFDFDRNHDILIDDITIFNWCFDLELTDNWWRSGQNGKLYIAWFSWIKLITTYMIIIMVFSATFNNISVISWLSVLLVDETGVPRENERPAASHWIYHIKLNRVHLITKNINLCQVSMRLLDSYRLRIISSFIYTKLINRYRSWIQSSFVCMRLINMYFWQLFILIVFSTYHRGKPRMYK